MLELGSSSYRPESPAVLVNAQTDVRSLFPVRFRCFWRVPFKLEISTSHQQPSSHFGQKMNAIDALPEQLKKPRGRPPKAVKVAIPKPMTMARYADSPPPMLPKTELQRVKELKELLINSAGSNVVHKAVEIAMNDEHPAQMAAIKLCMDRMLPVSLFEKEGKQRSAVNITISGIGGVSIGDKTIDAEDIESKDV